MMMVMMWFWWWWCDVADTLIKWGGRTKGPFSSFSPSLRHSGDTSLITSPQQIQLLYKRSAGEKERKLNQETWSKGYQWQHWYLRSSKSEVDKNDPFLVGMVPIPPMHGMQCVMNTTPICATIIFFSDQLFWIDGWQAEWRHLKEDFLNGDFTLNGIRLGISFLKFFNILTTHLQVLDVSHIKKTLKI